MFTPRFFPPSNLENFEAKAGIEFVRRRPKLFRYHWRFYRGFYSVSKNSLEILFANFYSTLSRYTTPYFNELLANKMVNVFVVSSL